MDFDGVVCIDCGNRFRTEFDHVQPRVAGGPGSTGNLKPRCWSCHQLKTERDRKAGKLKPRNGEAKRGPAAAMTTVSRRELRPSANADPRRGASP
jgi:5-methylcytosine-specific restriction endonuclease McrA